MKETEKALCRRKDNKRNLRRQMIDVTFKLFKILVKRKSRKQKRVLQVKENIKI